jgi:hypothetical protein
MVFKLYSKALVCGLAVIFLSFPSSAQKSKNKSSASTKKKVVTLNAPLPDEPYNRGIEYHYEMNSNGIKIYPTYPGICSNMFGESISKETHPEKFSKIRIKAAEVGNHIVPYPSLENTVVHFEAGKLASGEATNCLKAIYIDSLDQMHDARMFFIEQVFDKEDEKRISKAMANLIAHCYGVITKEFETSQAQ